MEKDIRIKRELELWQDQLLQMKIEMEKKEMELERREIILKERECEVEKKEMGLKKKEFELQNSSFNEKEIQQVNNDELYIAPIETQFKEKQIQEEDKIQIPPNIPTVVDMSFFNVGNPQNNPNIINSQQYPLNNDSMFTSTPVNRGYQQQRSHVNPYMPPQLYQQVNTPVQYHPNQFNQYQQQYIPPTQPTQKGIPPTIQESKQTTPKRIEIPKSVPITMRQPNEQPKEFEIKKEIPIPAVIKPKDLQFEEMNVKKQNYKCEELLDNDLAEIEREMEQERKRDELERQQLQQEMLKSTPVGIKQYSLNDSLETIEPINEKKPSTSTRAALTLFGTPKKVEEKLTRYQEPKKIEPKDIQMNQSTQRKKTRFTLTGQPICSHPGCNRTTSINADDFCCCSICKTAYCEQHKNKLEIIIPTFKNLTSRKQVIKPYVVCENCKSNEDSGNGKHQQIGIINDKWDVFSQKRNLVIGSMRDDEERVGKGLELLISRRQKSGFFSRKENGKNDTCPVCDVLMNGAENMNITCDICLRKCCVGCSVHTTIAPTLIMGIQDPMAEYIKVVICKKCYNCTRRKTEDTRIELKKGDQSLNITHQKLIESEAMLKSLLKRLEDVVDNFKGPDDIKLFEQKEMFYVDGLNDVTNTLTQLKIQKDNLDKDVKSVMTNLVVAFSSLIENSSMRHAVIFARYSSKVKQLNLK